MDRLRLASKRFEASFEERREKKKCRQKSHSKGAHLMHTLDFLSAAIGTACDLRETPILSLYSSLSPVWLPRLLSRQWAESFSIGSW